jgi:hypothetical protein
MLRKSYNRKCPARENITGRESPGVVTKTKWLLVNRQSYSNSDSDGSEKSRKLVWDGRQPGTELWESPASKDVNREDEGATALEAVTRRQPVKI